MTYNSGPDGGHNKKMMMPLNLFKEEYTLPNQLPPENSSAITLDEVRYLQAMKVNKKFVEKHDDITKVRTAVYKRGDTFSFKGIRKVRYGTEV